MTWSYETFNQCEARLKEWHRWFAWHPVWYKGTGFWLEKVERRCLALNCYGADCYRDWEYRKVI